MGVAEAEDRDRSLSGEGVVLLGPGRDQRPQGSVGGEDPVVAVTVDAGRREDLGEAVQELQGREAQGGAAGEVGPWEEVEDLVGTVADQVEAVEGEGGPGTIPDEPLEACAVGSLDTDAAVEAEPAPVIPAEHVLGVVGLQEAVAAKVAEHPILTVCWRPSRSSWVRAVASWKRRQDSGLAGS